MRSFDPWRYAVRRTLLLLLIPVFLACGGDDDGLMGPSIPSVAGSWTYNMSNLSGGGLSCSTTGTSLVFNQSASTFTGTYSGGTLSCTGGGGTASVPVGTGTVVNGSVTTAGAVSFDFDTQDWRNTGTLSGNSISGTVVVRIDLGAPTGVITLSGNFSAAR